MNKMKISDSFETNTLSFFDRDTKISEINWSKHPKYDGVYLKHLIQGSDTNGALSCHIVKIEPNCTIDTHTHEGIFEIHEVIEGSGTCFLVNKIIIYSVGSVAVIPADTIHKIAAGNDGMYILAKYSPALM